MLCKLGDAGLPLRKGRGFLALVWSDSDGAPTWFRLIVVCGKAPARSAISDSGEIQPAKMRLSADRRVNPARQVRSGICPLGGLVRYLARASLASQVTEWRMPRKRHSSDYRGAQPRDLTAEKLLAHSRLKPGFSTYKAGFGRSVSGKPRNGQLRSSLIKRASGLADRIGPVDPHSDFPPCSA
jgi:hypothetical protein